jgi:hypothetical protein
MRRFVVLFIAAAVAFTFFVNGKSAVAADSGKEKEKWEVIFVSVDEGKTLTYYGNPESVSATPEKTVKMWVKTVGEKGGKFFSDRQRMLKTAGKDETRYHYTKMLWEMDCKKKKFKVLSITENDDKGNVIAAADYPKNEWLEAGPTAVSNSVIEFACGKGK